MASLFILEYLIIKKRNVFIKKVKKKIKSTSREYRWNNLFVYVIETFTIVIVFSGVNLLNTDSLP